MTALQPFTPDQMRRLAADPTAAKHLARTRTRGMYRQYTAGELHGEALRRDLLTAWREALAPLSWLTRDQWLELFGAVGYCVNGRPADRPTQPLTLWRGVAQCRLSRRMVKKHTNGAITDPAYGWSWTDDLQMAREYAKARAVGDLAGHAAVYRANVPPAALLARIIPEYEYVVDTAQLTEQPERIE